MILIRPRKAASPSSGVVPVLCVLHVLLRLIRLLPQWIVVSASLTCDLVPRTSASIVNASMGPDTDLYREIPKYKTVLARARCQAYCNEKHGMQKMASPTELNDSYRPFLCGSDPIICQQCSTICNMRIEDVGQCNDTCANNECTVTCGVFNQTLEEEFRTEALVYAGSQHINLTVSSPTPACLYTPIPENVTSEGSTIILKWNVQGANGQSSTSPLCFVIEVQEETRFGNLTNWDTIGYTNFSVMPIVRLNPESKYRLRVSAVSQAGLISQPSMSTWITLPLAEAPQPVKNISVHQYMRGHNVRAEVRWDVANNVGCYFRVYWMSLDGISFNSRELREWIGNRCELYNLLFENVYKLEIETFDRFFSRSSKRVFFEFKTLNCLRSTNASYNLCAPDAPRNLQYQIQEPYKKNNSMYTNVTLTWQPPKYVSRSNTFEKYLVTWRLNPDIQNYAIIKADRGVCTIDARLTSWTMTNVVWGAEYIVYLAAESKAGTGEKTWVTVITGPGYADLVDSEANLLEHASRPAENLYFATIIPATLAVAAVSICLFYYIKLKKNSRHFAGMHGSRREAINPFYEYTVTKVPPETEALINTDEYEVDYSCLKLTIVLGEGAFGKVMKAEFTPSNTYQRRVGSDTKTVAVKMLKEHATPEERRFLLLETSAMKALGHHPNIVSIIACVTNSTRPCIIMDYCPLGDLRNYLRQHRTKVHYTACVSMSSSFSSNVNSTGNSTKGSMVNGTSEKNSFEDQAQPDALSQTTLLSYARQIAQGMEYLNQNRFIHRDLASRNILMASPKMVKISDFGLSRDVYETNAYQPTSARKLPFKWMPIEAIFDQVFTIKSDVWSYGILLWEIVTLGGCPYPGVPNSDLFRLLSEGYRLERPNNCSHDIYKIMLTCWHPCLDDRPSFTQLKNKIESLLEATCSYIDLSKEVSADYYRNDSSDQQEQEFSTVTKSSDVGSDHMPTGNISADTYSSQATAENPMRASKRYSRFETSSSFNENFAQVCAHYPVSKGPYVLGTNGPVPGLSEELLHKTPLSQIETSIKENGHHGLTWPAESTRSSPDISNTAESSLQSEALGNTRTSSWQSGKRCCNITKKPDISKRPKQAAAGRRGDMFGLDCVYPAEPPIQWTSHPSDEPIFLKFNESRAPGTELYGKSNKSFLADLQKDKGKLLLTSDIRDMPTQRTRSCMPSQSSEKSEGITSTDSAYCASLDTAPSTDTCSLMSGESLNVTSKLTQCSGCGLASAVFSLDNPNRDLTSG
ncbi:unnamed protein product [Lymnaea stagnalis]|uniref:receptor protein-tyrosine kinase n=1 Tax=Lymnaea stagnalis TaxID=6523 RepID=A0AAV2GZP1_LYMST